jgi:hypothetical protein
VFIPFNLALLNPFLHIGYVSKLEDLRDREKRERCKDTMSTGVGWGEEANG